MSFYGCWFFPSSVVAWLGPERLPSIRERLLSPGTWTAATLPKAWLETLLATPESVRGNALTVHSLLVVESWHRVFCRSGATVAAGAGARAHA